MGIKNKFISVAGKGDGEHAHASVKSRKQGILQRDKLAYDPKFCYLITYFFPRWRGASLLVTRTVRVRDVWKTCGRNYTRVSCNNAQIFFRQVFHLACRHSPKTHRAKWLPFDALTFRSINVRNKNGIRRKSHRNCDFSCEK